MYCHVFRGFPSSEAPKDMSVPFHPSDFDVGTRSPVDRNSFIRVIPVTLSPVAMIPPTTLSFSPVAKGTFIPVTAVTRLYSMRVTSAHVAAA
jgi:hypothetical protein